MGIISITGNKNSTLAKASNIHIHINIDREACPLNLAPTASTTATLSIGDALAAALIESRNFSSEDFAISHPSGSLGKRLILTVGDIMHQKNRMPKIGPDQSLSDGVVVMSEKSLGVIVIVDELDAVMGIYTDGDLRRTFDKKVDIHKTKMKEVMNEKFIHSNQDMLAIDAMRLLKKHKITQLIIVDKNNKLIGVLNIHDLLQAGIVRSV